MVPGRLWNETTVTVLVTGGAGFIGSHIVDQLLAHGQEVAVLDNFSTGRPENLDHRARVYRLDLRDQRLASILERERPKVVCHHAAQANLRRSVTDPVFDAQVNILGSVHLFESCRRTGVERIVFASSGGAIYGDTPVVPTPEDHAPRPASPYGIAKLAVEHYLTCWQNLHGGSAISLRYANVYGPRQDPYGEAGVVAIFARRMIDQDQPVVNGDGEQTRDFVYVTDVAEAVMCALERREVVGAFNIGTGVETSVNRIFRRLRSLAGVGVEERHGPPMPGEQRRSALDISLAKRHLRWSPQVSLDEGLARTLEFFRRSDRD